MREFWTLILASTRFEKSCVCWSIPSNPPHNLAILSNSPLFQLSKDILWWYLAFKPWFLRIYGVYQLVPFVQIDVHFLWNYRFGGHHFGSLSCEWTKEDSGENGLSLGMKPSLLVSAMNLAVNWRSIWLSSQLQTTLEGHLAWSMGVARVGCSWCCYELLPRTWEGCLRDYSKVWLEFFRAE